MYSVATPCSPRHSTKDCAANSGPFSTRTAVGSPCTATSPPSTRTTLNILHAAIRMEEQEEHSEQSPRFLVLWTDEVLGSRCELRSALAPLVSRGVLTLGRLHTRASHP